jgi:hypothetical protein
MTLFGASDPGLEASDPGLDASDPGFDASDPGLEASDPGLLASTTLFITPKLPILSSETNLILQVVPIGATWILSSPGSKGPTV